MKHVRLFLPLVVAALLAGCMSQPAKPVAQQILGEWHTTIGGYPVTVTYTSSTVSVSGAEAVSYKLDGDKLMFPNGGSQVRIVSFPSGDEMVQTDPLTGTVQHYRRAGPATVASPDSDAGS